MFVSNAQSEPRTKFYVQGKTNLSIDSQLTNVLTDDEVVKMSLFPVEEKINKALLFI